MNKTTNDDERERLTNKLRLLGSEHPDLLVLYRRIEALNEAIEDGDVDSDTAATRTRRIREEMEEVEEAIADSDLDRGAHALYRLLLGEYGDHVTMPAAYDIAWMVWDNVNDLPAMEDGSEEIDLRDRIELGFAEANQQELFDSHQEDLLSDLEEQIKANLE